MLDRQLDRQFIARSQLCGHLGEVKHAGAEGRGGAEQSLDETTAQLEPFGYIPQVCLFQ